MSAALKYAQLGWRILPAWPCTKKGMFPHQQASSDPAVIAGWAREHPGCNWAVVLGSGSGIVAIDCENSGGDRTITALEREHGPLPDLWPCVWSGGGGWHGYFSHRTGQTRNCHLGEGVEFRGDTLLLTLPPSVHPNGRRYRWDVDRHPGNTPPPPLPDAWIALVAPLPEPKRAAWKPGWDSRVRGNRHLESALTNELAIVAQAPIGTRNDQLNRSAFSLFRLIDDGLDENALTSALFAAAQACGLSAPQINATIRSAAKARRSRL
jgi:hypothetical protein